MSMNEVPRISVIMPVYNAERWLSRSIGSIISQNFVDFELILVDDGSKDSSPAICDEYASMDSRIRVIHKTNGGVSSARNTGIEYATGEYITFADSDDEMCPNALSNLAKYDEDIVISGIVVFLNDLVLERKPQNAVYYDKKDFHKIIETHYNDACLRGPYAKSIRKSIITDNNLRFDDRIHWGEDYLFNLQLMAKATKIRLIDAITYRYYMGIGGSYKFSIDEFNHTGNVLENAITYFGSCKAAVEGNRKGLYAILMCYVSSHRKGCKLELLKRAIKYRIWRKFPTDRKLRCMVELSRVLFIGH